MKDLVPRDLSDSAGEPEEELQVHMGAGDGAPERLLHIARPVDGMVRVREWSGDNWNTTATERQMPVDVLLEAFEEASLQRRRLSEAMYSIRRWLTGRGD